MQVIKLLAKAVAVAQHRAKQPKNIVVTKTPIRADAALDEINISLPGQFLDHQSKETSKAEWSSHTNGETEDTACL